MAITAVEYTIFTHLRPQLPPRPAMLQLGEANWYGDVPDEQLEADVVRYVAFEAERRRLADEIASCRRGDAYAKAFGLARVFWHVFVDPSTIVSIDLSGTGSSLRLDLNAPVDLGQQFDLVLNLGTAEHVFNIFQVFKTIHDHTKPGGLMIHSAPFAGWVDHGFYNFQPTLWWDLAAANAYTVHGIVCAELNPIAINTVRSREQLLAFAHSGQMGPNSLLYPIFRKNAVEAPFQVPMQGYYAGAVSEDARSAWQVMR